ncbi:hypothetical protein OIU84_013871 [Salix udensis]|uniref:Uncharacterized protein n=1 Tax=Salix udensis TaxID=889485 RepID=A0AAD6JJN7_9ROSI|nr:hypothetical protein OIU84_013871 [Salix udensis]
MSSETEEAQDSNGTSTMSIVHYVVRSLPSHAVKDLHSAGLCIRCIFRLFGIRDHAFFRFTLSPSVMSNILGDSKKKSPMETTAKLIFSLDFFHLTRHDRCINILFSQSVEVVS